MYNVMITGVGGAGGVSVLKALREGLGEEARLVGVDANPLSSGRFFTDAFYPVPYADSPAFASALLTLCRRENTNMVIVSVDEELEVLADKQAMFAAAGVRLAVPSPETVEACGDKLATWHFFSGRGVAAPVTWPTGEFDIDCLLRWAAANADAAEALASAGRDCEIVVKPRRGRGSRDVYVLPLPEWPRWAGRFLDGEFIVQPRIRGREYTVDMLLNLQGEVMAAVPRERLETDSGLSIKGRTEKNDILIERSSFVAQELGLTGAANIQWIVDGNGVPWLIEVNPRLAGSVALSVAAGVNIPAELVKLYCLPGYQGSKLKFQGGVTMLRYWEAVFCGDGAL